MTNTDSSAPIDPTKETTATAGVVIERDFGKKDRESVRKFSRLMNIVESKEREILANPVKYIAMAGDDVQRLMDVIESLKEALSPNMATALSQVECVRPDLLETIKVTRAEYDRWQKAKAILYAPLPAPATPETPHE